VILVQVIILETYLEISERAAAIVADLVSRKPDAVLALPTGSTPEGCYRALIRKDVALERVRTFNLDEYRGLGREHPQSYYQYMRRNLFNHVAIPEASIHIPDGMAPDPEVECRRYEEAIRAVGGLDLVLMGLGHNGHIGFNEPGTPWDARTRRVMLTDATRTANARFFGSKDLVPTEAITMGIGTMLEARQIVLLASGSDKAEIVRRTLEGAPGIDVPGTALQSHSNVTVLLDRAAAAALQWHQSA
jgi:glucosamine-6-phosphate deaminase